MSRKKLDEGGNGEIRFSELHTKGDGMTREQKEEEGGCVGWEECFRNPERKKLRRNNETRLDFS
jgi:hypothetical protein